MGEAGGSGSAILSAPGRLTHAALHPMVRRCQEQAEHVGCQTC